MCFFARSSRTPGKDTGADRLLVLVNQHGAALAIEADDEPSARRTSFAVRTNGPRDARHPSSPCPGLRFLDGDDNLMSPRQANTPLGATQHLDALTRLARCCRQLQDLTGIWIIDPVPS